MAIEENNYYRLYLKNNSELFVESDLFTKTEEVVSALSKKTFDMPFIKLKLISSDKPREVYYAKSSIMTIEKVSSAMIGLNTKLWKIVE